MSSLFNSNGRALDGMHQSTDIENVVPIVVPRLYFELGNWPGPYAFLRAGLLGLTWTVLNADQTMVYVTRNQATSWENDGIPWKEQAQANLRQASKESLWTHEKRGNDGRLLWAAMMHADGLGASRLLLREELLAALKQDYRLGMPDRSCGIVVPMATEHSNVAEVAKMVRHMYDGATTPMMPDLLYPQDLEVIQP